MSANQNRRIDEFSRYDNLPTEELEEILRLDAELPEGQESDEELIFYVMEVLAERKRNNGRTEKTVLEAFESFKQNYMPEKDHVIPTKRKNGSPRWIRGLTATAAVLVVLLVGSVTAKSFGFDVQKAVVHWTQETFHFGQSGDPTPNNNLSYASLQEALEDGNTPAWLVPTWIPDGFKIKDIQVKQTPLKKTYKAIYTNAEKNLLITVQNYLDGVPYYAEQSDGLTEEYTASGITYYLLKNNKHAQALWIVDSYECCISGDVTIDELKMMISSIEKG